MALGTGTVVSNDIQAASAPIFIKEISFAGDNAYPTGGTAAFQAYVRALLKMDVQLIAVLPCALNGVYNATYVTASDKLLISIAANTEVANATDLSGTTFKLKVLCV
jgi:pyrroline-5-carboxylate reductase